ncbi:MULTISPECIES: hypothetical protein [Burkholderia]|jgi:hypothetical protein|uniref:hypothetical protein n=1 Tax=Burkholderia TaxID=32008 RepID=UPI00086BBD2E|nr:MULTISPECIES: hypothetical protein [Burkholderia]MDP9548274.1 hypothetical protein [Burkholderia cepacia]MBR8393194.1 hypothetical protein [Burkholderia cenocepacia]MBR8470694.1 hypothetical protein [Burkholderia cenocepacia]MBR8494112.1 hypothetical protein [Burkholderia cenocepacia]MDO5923917.1 hypothetical protein [Burkholderia cenocepacia]
MKLYCALLLCLFTFACKPTAGSKCTKSLTLYKTQVDTALAEETIDQPVYDGQQRYIAKAEKICASGDDEAAVTALFDAAMALNVGADDTYARSLKKEGDPGAARVESER